MDKIDRMQTLRRRLRVAVYVHLTTCAILLVAISYSLGGNTSSDLSGLVLSDKAIIWTLDHPYVFYWSLLAFNFVGIYILHSRREAGRLIAIRCYTIAMPIAILLHIGIVAAASFRGTIQSPIATYVVEGFGVLWAVASGDILLALPLGLVILHERLRLTGTRHGCPGCGYDLVGLSGDVCPECGRILQDNCE